MDLFFIMVIFFVVHFVKAYAEQSGQDYYNKRKRTNTCPNKRSGSKR